MYKEGFHRQKPLFCCIKILHIHAGQGVEHSHMHYKALLKIILQSALLLPVDNDILYMDDCIIRLIILTVTTGRKAVAAYTIIDINLFLHSIVVFCNKNHLTIKYTQSRT